MRRRVVSYLLDLVFRPRCAGCRRSGQTFCDGCSQKVRADARRLDCRVCRSPLAPGQAGFGAPCPVCRNPLGFVQAAALHEEPLQKAVHAFKYEGRKELGPSLARYLVAELMKEPWPALLTLLDAIVPVPLHEDRYRERGYNQAALLARSVADIIKRQYISDALTKTRATVSQVDLSRRERTLSLTNAFVANYDFEDAHVLLVDDVSTTGNTLMNCAVALKRAGARRVSGLVFAKEGDGESAEVEYQSSPTRSRYSST